MPTFAGIDVSAHELTVALIDGGPKAQLSSFEQTPAGHKALVKYLKKRKVERVVAEATGVYYLDAAMALDRAGLCLSVINPRSAHNFAKSLLESSKTDRIDAVLLAEYGRRMEPRRWRPPSPELLAVRDIARRINQLTANGVAARNRLHALSSKQCTDALLIEDAEDEIASLERRIRRLTQAARERIDQNPEMSRIYQLLTSATGIAETSGIKLLAELCLLDRSMNSRQVSRHAGLSVRLNESGSSQNKPGRLSKAGNTYLRAAMHMPALVLVQHDPIARAHYEHLIDQGKKKLQALCAIQRKMLTGLWACIKTDQAFNTEKLFAIRPE
jgi:transposase